MHYKFAITHFYDINSCDILKQLFLRNLWRVVARKLVILQNGVLDNHYKESKALQDYYLIL